jgi:hypothetical protein
LHHFGLGRINFSTDASVERDVRGVATLALSVDALYLKWLLRRRIVEQGVKRYGVGGALEGRLEGYRG